MAVGSPDGVLSGRRHARDGLRRKPLLRVAQGLEGDEAARGHRAALRPGSAMRGARKQLRWE
jgi:hypothetical protein